MTVQSTKDPEVAPDRSAPETARTIFDPLLRIANREATLFTAEVFESIAREQADHALRMTFRLDEL